MNSCIRLKPLHHWLIKEFILLYAKTFMLSNESLPLFPYIYITNTYFLELNLFEEHHTLNFTLKIVIELNYLSDYI